MLILRRFGLLFCSLKWGRASMNMPACPHFNEQNKRPNLLSIITWSVLGKQNVQAEKVYWGKWCFNSLLKVYTRASEFWEVKKEHLKVFSSKCESSLSRLLLIRLEWHLKCPFNRNMKHPQAKPFYLLCFVLGHFSWNNFLPPIYSSILTTVFPCPANSMRGVLW